MPSPGQNGTLYQGSLGGLDFAIGPSNGQQHVDPSKKPASEAKTWLDDLLPANVVHSMDGALFQTVRQFFRSRAGMDATRIIWIITVLIPAAKYSYSTMTWLRENGTNSIKLNTDEQLTEDLQVWVKRQPMNSLFSWLPTFKSLEWTRRGWGRRHEDPLFDRDELVPAGGSLIFLFQGIPFLLRLPPQHDPRREGYLILYCLWGNAKPIQALLKHIRQLYSNKKQYLRIKYRYTHTDRYGRILSEYYPGTKRNRDITAKKRYLDTIDMDPAVKQDILTDLQNYFDPNAEKYYNDCGVPYRRGYMFYGPPGTGKTSMSQAIASEYDLDLYVFCLADMTDSDLQAEFQELPSRCVCLFEDIDNAGIVRESSMSAVKPSANQTEKPQVAETQDNKVAGQKEEALSGTTKVAALHSESPQDQPQKAQTVKVEKQTKVTLSGLLNAIDGPGSKEGRLLIMTTNAPDVLDKALYRRGRIDRKFHLSYSTKQSAALTFMRIFGRDPLNEVPEKKLTSMSKRFANKIPKGVFTPSDIQEFCLTYRGRPQDAVDSIAQFVEDKLSGKHGFEYDITRLNKEPSMAQKLETEDEDDMLSEDEYEEDSESSRPSLGRTDSGSSSSTSSGQLAPASSQFRLFDTERKLEELLAPSPPASDDASPASSRWNLNPLSLIGSVFKYGRKQPKQMDVTDLLLPAIMMNCEGQISPYVQRELLPGTRSPSIWSLSSRQSTPPLSSLSSEESTPPLSSLSSEERISEVEAAVHDDNEANGDVEDDIEGTLSEASDDTFFYSSCSSEGQIEDTFQRFRTPSHEDVAGSLNQYPYHGALDGEEEDGHTMLLRSMPPTPIDETEVLDLGNGNGGEAGTVQMEQDDEVEDLDEQVEETAVAAADK